MFRSRSSRARLLRQKRDRAFGRTIDRRAGKAVIAKDRTDIDDLATAIALEDRQHALTQKEHAFDVGAQHGVDRLFAGSSQRRHQIGGGIVDQNVDGSVRLDDARNRALDVGGATHVGPECGGIATAGLYRTNNGLRFHFVSIEDRDLGTLSRITLGQGFADALRSARYHRNLPLEPHRRFSVGRGATPPPSATDLRPGPEPARNVPRTR